MLELIKEFLTLQWMKKVALMMRRLTLSWVRWVITRELWRGWIHRESAVSWEVVTVPLDKYNHWRIRGYKDGKTGADKELWDDDKESAIGTARVFYFGDSDRTFHPDPELAFEGFLCDGVVVKNVKTGEIAFALGNYPPQTELPELPDLPDAFAELEEDIPF